MTHPQDRVHGSIFFLLRKYIAHLYSEEMWEQINQEAGTDMKVFENTMNYDLWQIGAIMTILSEKQKCSVSKMQESFGEFLVPDLFKLYGSYLRPEWKTFEVVEHTENVMHGAVRKLNSTANPPILSVSRVNENLLIIDYYSKRRMGSLAVGIIMGIAKYFHEEDKIHITPTTENDAERVQIKIERL